MTVAWNSYAGLAVGTTLTAANSGGVSGTAFDTVTTGSGGTQVADNTHLPSGPYALKIQATTAAATFSQWLASFSFATTFFRRYFYFTANPGATIRLFNITDASSVMSVSLNSTGHLVVTFGSGGTNFVTFTNAIPLNAPFRIEGFCIESATAGQVSLTLYPGESTSATETHTSAASLNTGTFSAPKSSWDDSNTLGTIGPYWAASPALSSTNLLGPALYISTTSLPAATAGTVYGSTLATTGGTGAVTWSLFSGSLPPGVTLSSGGVISGTPSTTGGFGFVVQATDANGNVFRQSLTIPVAGSGGGGPSPILQPPAGFAWFGAYPAPSSGRPATYEAGVLGGTRQLACFSRYYQVQSAMLATDATDVAAGRFLVMNLAPSFTVSNTSAAITYANITAGTYDTNIVSIATTLAGYASPVIVLWAHEMETSALQGYGTSAQFIASFQHVANLMRATAPGRVIMGWGTSGIHAGAYYPGDAYVDWIFVDPYDPTLSNGAGEPSTGPALTFRPFMTWLQAQSFGAGKPVGLFETGVQQPSGSNSNTDANVATWIGGIASEMGTLGYQMLIWFNAGGTLGSTQIPAGTLSAAAMSAQGQLAFFNPPAVAPASVAYQIGSTSTNDTVTTVSIIATVPTGTNDGIVVGASINSGSALPLSCADDAGNTYVLQGNSIDTSIGCAQFVTTGTTTALTAGQKITVTFPAAAATGKTVMACGVPGMFTSSAVDVAVKADDTTGTSTTPLASTGTLAQSTEMIIACEFSTHTGLAIDWNSPLSPVVGGFQALGGNQWAAMGAGLTTSTAPVNAGGTITAAKWVLLAVAVKVAASPFITTGSLPDAFTGVAYSQTLTAVSGSLPYTWSVSSGSLPAGFSLSSAGVITGSSAVTESATFTVEVTDANSNTDTQVLTLAVANNVQVTTPSLPPGTTGTAYSTTLTAGGGTAPYTWAVTSGSLPAGLSISGGGVISGTPQTAVSATFTVTATDASSNTGSASLSITVASNLAVTTSSLPGGVTGVAYSQSLNASGGFGAYTWSNPGGGLPSGLSLSGAVISGTPTGSGPSTFTVEVTDAGGNIATASLTITVSAVLQVATTGPLPTGTPGVSYTTTLAAAGGSAPYTWTISAGLLPPGLSIAGSTGVISGTPEASGSFSFTAKVTDSLSETATAFLGISVSGTGPPSTNLDLDVDLNLAGNWANISGYVMQREGTSPPVTIVRGRPPESAQCNPASALMQWNNRDGRFSRGNPVSPYYGLFGRNTPLRVSIPAGGVYLRMDDDNGSNAFARDTTSLQITGTIDVRLDCELSGYQQCMLVYKWGAGGQSWQFILNSDGTLTFNWWTGSATATATSTAALPNLGRIMMRAVLNTSGQTVQFWTAPTMGGAETQLGATIFTGTTALSGGATQAIGIGKFPPDPGPAGMTGRVFEFQLYNGVGGSGGTLVADPVFTAQAAAAASFADAQGNTWAFFGTAELSDRSYRFHGECSALPQNQDTTGADVWVPVTASGILRRLQQGSANIQSPFRRAVSGLDGVVAYWPMEDPQGATQFASGIPGGIPMTGGGGTPTFADNEDFVCSNELPVLNGAVVIGSVQPYVPTGTIVVRALIEPDPDMAAAGSNLFFVSTTGSHGTLIVNYQPGGLWTVQTPDSVLFAQAFGIPAGPVMLSVELVQSGSDAVLSIVLMTPSGEVFVAAGLGAAGTVGIARKVWTQPGTGATVAGHFYVQDVLEPLSSMAGPLAAWAGETAANRFARLCTENTITPRIYGFPDDSVIMGPQQIDTLQNVLQSCEDADRGQIYDPAETFGLGYRPLSALVNQAQNVTPLALGWSGTGVKQLGDGDQMVGTTDDDQFTCNDMTVTRNNGSSYQFQLNDGSPMSISPPPAGAGDYAQAVTQYLNGDYQLPDAAGWLVHTGTCDEERYPVIPLNLARSELSGLITAIQDARLGDYVQVSSPPGYLTPDVIRQIITQTTEQLGGQWWRIAWAAAPESPYETMIWDDLVYGRWDTDGATLASSASAAATTLSVATASPLSPLWTTVAADFPFDVEVAGERITVTSITGTSSPQTFTVTRSVNGVVKPQAAAADVRLWFPPIYALT